MPNPHEQARPITLNPLQVAALLEHLHEMIEVKGASDREFIARLNTLAQTFPPAIEKQIGSVVDEWSKVVNELMAASVAEVQRITGRPAAIQPTKQ